MAVELYVGLMSGTSMDAADAVLVDLGDSRPELMGTHSQPISASLRAELLALAAPGADEITRLGQLDIRLGQLFAESVNLLLDTLGVAAEEVTAIGSHGQTVRHSPGGAWPFTVQIGDPNVIAEKTGITTVADFRRRDMAAGGQGAPLVPAFHAALFRNDVSDRVVVNIGGMANVTILPAISSKPVTGFDTGPGNVLLDGWVQHKRGQDMDTNGEWAAGGQVQKDLLTSLLADPYFRQPPPKSTGREHFAVDWLSAHLRGDERAEDVQATLAALTARSIVDAIDTYAQGVSEVLVCGGGAYNSFLMELLRQYLPDAEVSSTEAYGIEPRWVEATAFAWLARQTLLRRPGNLPEVTGARRKILLGGIYYP